VECIVIHDAFIVYLKQMSFFKKMQNCLNCQQEFIKSEVRTHECPDVTEILDDVVDDYALELEQVARSI